MQTFSYQAYTENGEKRKGTRDAESAVHLRQLLRSQGLILISFTHTTSSPSRLFLFRNRIKKNDLMLITRQLATLVDSGIPLEESMRMMSQQAETPQVKKIMTSLRSFVAEGYGFATSLRKSSFRFPEDYIATIYAAEETGHLAQGLNRLADEVEQSEKTRQTIVGALLYPALMLIVSIGVISLLLVYVVPQVTRVFSQMKQELPPLTQMVLSISDALQAYGLQMLIVILSGILGFGLILRKRTCKYHFDRFLLTLPSIGYWLTISHMAAWARSLGMLLANGIPILEAMQIASQRVRNLALHTTLQDVAKRVREGDGLHKALSNHKSIPPFIIHLISSGETSGTLDKMLLRIADYYDYRIHALVGTSLKLFEPLLIIIMGCVVFLIVMAILVPIIQMNQLI